jgi:hypothetical protein
MGCQICRPSKNYLELDIKFLEPTTEDSKKSRAVNHKDYTYNNNYESNFTTTLTTEHKQYDNQNTAESDNIAPNNIDHNIEKCSDYSQIANPSILSEIKLQEYDFDEHSRKVFKVINKLRTEPHKFIKKMNNLIKSFNKITNSLDIGLENISIVLPNKIDPLDSIAFLQTAQPQNPFLWSNLLQAQGYEDLTFKINSIKYQNISNEEEISIKNKNSRNYFTDIKVEITKMLADFIVNPKITVLILFLMSQENRCILLASDICECAIVTIPENQMDYYTNKGFTLVNYIKPIA